MIEIIAELLDAVCAPATKTKMMNRAIIMDRGLMVKSLPLSSKYCAWVVPILYIFTMQRE
jgi:hypothetical protein